jgi:hypothetical protein
MTTTTTHPDFGRLGNQIIRNLAVSLIAEKHNLTVYYGNKELINKLGIELFSGSNIHTSTEKLTDDNYFNVYNSDNVNYNLDPNRNFFQTKEISNFLYNHLHTDKVKSTVIENNPFKERYHKNNDLYVHIRLTDAAHHNPGITYYANAINSINFDDLYISTDDKNHSLIIEILKLYPSAKLISLPPPTAISAQDGIPNDAPIVTYEDNEWVQLWDPDKKNNYWYCEKTKEAQWDKPGEKSYYDSQGGKLIEFDEIKTIQFASTCKNIILSHGSFSAIIGFLSFFSNVHYPEYESHKIWYGDMFSINNWIKLRVK